MNRTDFELFISKNRLKKKDIAEYLGVSSAFITALCSGARPVPSDKIDLIKSNTYWDTSMFADDDEMLRESHCPTSADNTAASTGEGKMQQTAALSSTPGLVTIPQSVWAVIENQAASLKAKDDSLKIKDEQMDRLITQIEQSNSILKTTILGTYTGFPAAPTDLGVKNPSPIKSELK